ncbi:UvrD-helicase domain-containing protein [Pseudoalteromonas sp. T1lg65]|uniref:UvrD-helicase domain-containing protein n=1 Tax=Pseudoalteromonas sp. T1lg65 TaxID=2077101 RepID=UPI003F7A2F94
MALLIYLTAIILITLPLLLRVLFRIRAIQVIDDGIELHFRHQVLRIAITQLTAAPYLRRSMWYSRLVLTMANSTQSVVLPSRTGQGLFRQILPLWLALRLPHLYDCAAQVERLLKQQYLNARRLQQVQYLCNKTIDSWLNVERKRLPLKAVRALATLQEIASWTSIEADQFRAAYIKYYLARDRAFFSTIEANPLTRAQQQACVIQDDRQLLLAGAGTGKTSVIKAKVAYLLHRKHAHAQDILMLAYGNQAAQEMQQRCESVSTELSCSTFHSLGMRIISAVEGKKPKLSSLAASNQQLTKFVQDTVISLLQEPAYRDTVNQARAACNVAKEAPLDIKNLKPLIQLTVNALPLIKQAKTLGHLDSVKLQFPQLLAVILPILAEYQLFLQHEGGIDFDDMLDTAISYVSKGLFISPWRYILVDEFQDISRVRMKLVDALLANREQSQLFAVGDDWQSIYRFSGGDISLTTQFRCYFGLSTITQLDQTFRYSESILQPTSRFICRNPAQIVKRIHATSKAQQEGLVKIVMSDLERTVTQVLERIKQQMSEPVSVMFLARNHQLLPTNEQVELWRKSFPSMDFSRFTFHAAKGSEADFTILMGLEAAYLPSKRVTHPLLDALLPNQEPFPDAEERRLFYVALTRAKQQSFLLVPDNPSAFIEELELTLKE